MFPRQLLKERLTSHEALVMPFFAVSFHRHLVETKQILESDEKIELVRQQARLLQVMNN